MGIRIVADTHALLWYLYNDPHLSREAGRIMSEIEQAGEQIAIASITLAEIVYLVEKGRIQALAFERIVAALEEIKATLIEMPFDRAIAIEMRRIDRSQVPDLPDRIVAATASYLRVPLISRDRKIRSSAVNVIW